MVQAEHFTTVTRNGLWCEKILCCIKAKQARVEATKTGHLSTNSQDCTPVNSAPWTLTSVKAQFLILVLTHHYLQHSPRPSFAPLPPFSDTDHRAPALPTSVTRPSLSGRCSTLPHQSLAVLHPPTPSFARMNARKISTSCACRDHDSENTESVCDQNLF